MRKIKILFTIPNFDTAGSGKVLYDLAKGLNKAIFEVHIACSHQKGLFFKEVEKLGIPIHIIETTCKLRPYVSLLKRVAPYKKFIKEQQFDVVHSWHWSSDWTEVLGAKWGGAKFVYTKKAMTWGNVHWKLRSYLADYIVTINSEMKAYFPNKKKQSLVPIGLDTSYYSPERFSVRNANTIKLITVANLVPVKGIETLINAMVVLNNPNIELTIVGDDRSQYAKDLKQMVNKLKVKDKIRFLGKQMDVRSFLNQHDLFVIPTLNEGRREGMPMALVEAMSMGIPVIGSDITGINFVLKDFKELLFTAGNAQDLAHKINEFMKLNSQDRDLIGRKLRQYVIEHFSMEQFLKSHEDIYLSLIK